ncbi:hypothetical protein [Anaerobacillus arseniciselenatis]|nr:hypothetical protein [Anaerobacillus arseniciselenatis]
MIRAEEVEAAKLRAAECMLLIHEQCFRATSNRRSSTEASQR